MTNRARHRRTTLRTLLCAALFLAPALASAQSVPGKISYQGRLLKADGTPESGIIDFTFGLFSAATGGTAMWTETQHVGLTSGFYQLFLGDVTAFPAGLFDGTDRFLEVTVAGSVLAPRQRIGSVPYALLAGTAQSVSTGTLILDARGLRNASGTVIGSSGLLDRSAFDTSTVQLRVTGTCATGSFFAGINADGSVSCASPSASTSIQNGTTQQTASFNISGAGTIGGTLNVGGATTLGVANISSLNVGGTAQFGALTASGAANVLSVHASSFGQFNGDVVVGGKTTSGNAIVGAWPGDNTQAMFSSNQGASDYSTTYGVLQSVDGKNLTLNHGAGGALHVKSGGGATDLVSFGDTSVTFNTLAGGVVIDGNGISVGGAQVIGATGTVSGSGPGGVGTTFHVGTDLTVDGNSSLGNATVGAWPHDNTWAMFSSKQDPTSAADYAASYGVIQSVDGKNLYLNHATGGSIHVQSGGATDLMTISDNSVSFAVPSITFPAAGTGGITIDSSGISVNGTPVISASGGVSSGAIDTTAFQSRVSGTCGATAGITGINANGTVTCRATDALDTSFIHNGSTQETASFNVSGSGAVGTTFNVGTNLIVSGNGSVGGTFGVGTNLNVTGNGTVGGTFGVTGNSTFAGTLGVTGNETVGGTLTSTGALTVGSSNAGLNSRVVVDGPTNSITFGSSSLTSDVISIARVQPNNAVLNQSDLVVTIGDDENNGQPATNDRFIVRAAGTNGFDGTTDILRVESSSNDNAGKSEVTVNGDLKVNGAATIAGAANFTGTVAFTGTTTLSCRSGFTSVADGHLCFGNSLFTADSMDNAIIKCGSQAVSTHVCTHADFQQFCHYNSSGTATAPFNPYTVQPGWYGDKGSTDDQFLTWNGTGCGTNNDGSPAARTIAGGLPYRCCY